MNVYRHGKCLKHLSLHKTPVHGTVLEWAISASVIQCAVTGVNEGKNRSWLISYMSALCCRIQMTAWTRCMVGPPSAQSILVPPYWGPYTKFCHCSDSSEVPIFFRHCDMVQALKLVAFDVALNAEVSQFVTSQFSVRHFAMNIQFSPSRKPHCHLASVVTHRGHCLRI